MPAIIHMEIDLIFIERIYIIDPHIGCMKRLITDRQWLP
jgi:hypothetical protein